MSIQTCINKQGKHSGSSLTVGGLPKSHEKSSYFSPSSSVYKMEEWKLIFERNCLQKSCWIL